MTPDERLEEIRKLLDMGWDSVHMEYDTQAVNQAHRVAAGGPPPRETLDHETGLD